MSVPAARGPLIQNITLTVADTEYPCTLQDGSSNENPSLKKVMFRAEDGTVIVLYAFVSGGPYFTLKAGEVYWQDNLDSYAITLYLKSTTAGAVIDVETWY